MRLSLALLTAASCLAGATAGYAQDVPIEDVIAAIKAEIKDAQALGGEPGFEITQVDVSLTAVANSGTTGRVKFEIPVVRLGISAQLGRSLRSRQVLTFKLTPPPPPPPDDRTFIADSDTFGLVAAIDAAQSAFMAAARDEPVMNASDFLYSAELAVTNEKGVGLRFLFINSIEVDRENVAIQNFTFHMKANDTQKREEVR